MTGSGGSAGVGSARHRPLGDVERLRQAGFRLDRLPRQISTGSTLAANAGSTGSGFGDLGPQDGCSASSSGLARAVRLAARAAEEARPVEASGRRCVRGHFRPASSGGELAVPLPSVPGLRRSFGSRQPARARQFDRFGQRPRDRPRPELRHERAKTVGGDPARGIDRPCANHAVRDLAAYVRRLSAHPHLAAVLHQSCISNQ